jgi:hypothetical protein
VQHYFRLAAIVPALAVLPTLAADAKSDEALKARLLAGTTITGKLSAVDADGDVKKFTVQYPNSTQEVDPKGQQAYQDLLKRYNQAVQSKNKGNIQSLGPQVQKAQAAMYVTKDNPIDFDFTGDKNLKIRKQELPPKEVNGKPVPYTLAEKQQLRGSGADAALPGYAATVKDLQTDQYVKVYLDKAKSKASAGKKDADKDAHPITMIIIVPAPAQPGANPATKKN